MWIRYFEILLKFVYFKLKYVLIPLNYVISIKVQHNLNWGLWLYHTRINSLDTHDLTVHHTLSLITQSFLPREA